MGFMLHNIFANGGFESTRNTFARMGIVLNAASRNDNVPEIERYIRSVKERFANSLPFQKFRQDLQHRWCLPTPYLSKSSAKNYSIDRV